MAATGEALASLIERIENNPSVTDRLDATGLLPVHDAIALGVTGVAARASGVDRDARRDHPHAAYASERGLAVAVATEDDGDVHARMNVRAAEARESIRLVRVLLAGLPSGPIRAAMPAALPPWGIGLAAIESPRGAAIHWLRSDAAGRDRSLPPALGELRQLARGAARGADARSFPTSPSSTRASSSATRARTGDDGAAC